VVLSGVVDLYAYKLEAMKKAHKVPGVRMVLDNIAVGGPNMPDRELQQKLLSKIEVDREGYGQVFSAISVSVENGVVTLGGHARGPVTKESALALAQYMPGVKDVVDRIQVDPVNPLDDGIRLAEYNAIYNYAPLMQYAVVPSRPIRISVQNQNVTLYGIVDNEMDKDIIGIRANLVPHVFHVTNDLVVASQTTETVKK
jgi:osmotically-inducible protein OsmY